MHVPDPVSYAICLFAALAIILFANLFVPILHDIPASGVTPGQRVPYSLARVQMAFWTAVIVGSLVYIYWVLGSGKDPFPELDDNLVLLMGISGATGAAAAAIDIGKDATVEGAEAQFAGTSEAISALDAQILAVTSMPGIAGSDPTLSKLLEDRAQKMEELARQQTAMTRSKRADDDGQTAQAQAAQLKLTMPTTTQRAPHYIARFFREILEDQNGNSLHRLQLVMFTLIYGAYVIWHVATATETAKALDADMLDNQAMALLSVSSALYVGFKIPGKAS
jgi:hypothetical protein